MEKHARELLLDSEVALRLVGEAVEDELRGFDAQMLAAPRLRLELAEVRGEWEAPEHLDGVVRRAYAEVAEAVLALRCGRNASSDVAGGVLDEVERRLLCLARLLHPNVGSGSVLAHHP